MTITSLSLARPSAGRRAARGRAGQRPVPQAARRPARGRQAHRRPPRRRARARERERRRDDVGVLGAGRRRVRQRPVHRRRDGGAGPDPGVRSWLALRGPLQREVVREESCGPSIDRRAARRSIVVRPVDRSIVVSIDRSSLRAPRLPRPPPAMPRRPARLARGAPAASLAASPLASSLSARLSPLCLDLYLHLCLTSPLPSPASLLASLLSSRRYPAVVTAADEAADVFTVTYIGYGNEVRGREGEKTFRGKVTR